jgi:acetyl-CoA carboxylase biotin carboxylase subunit
MFRRIMIANRGEVAARVARTCRRLGVEVVAVASAADRDQAWLQPAAGLVDRLVVLGPARAADSYLDQDALMEVAHHTGCAAIHPGWGFLSENELFAARCEAAGITFIGPSATHIRQMGDKAVARRTMKALGLDPIPGTDGPISDIREAAALGEQYGYPLLLKAVAGGGGRGMRGVDAPGDLQHAFEAATAEAAASFGDGRVYVEKRIARGRHVEVQVIGDRFGNVVVLGERECSLQRRHQKVVEEGPAPGLSTEERARVLPRVADAVRRAGYVNAGTVEMLVDEDGRAWFMEMNTRLQVEHAVTELVTGLDLVELQLRVAAHERLPIRQEDVRTHGHAIEVRINAEDPAEGFRPCPGRVHTLRLPSGPGVRCDTHLTEGDRIPPNYDSMVVKLLAHGSDRDEALARLRAAIDATVVGGPVTNTGLLRRILDWAPFTSGRYDTTSLEAHLASLLGREA